MARIRKNISGHNDASCNKNSNGTSSSSAESDKLETVKKSGILNHWKSALGFACFSIAAYIGFLGYLETRVNTPFDEHKVVQRAGLDDPDRFWGSYRPGNYFGLRCRDPHSPLMGLMWYAPARLRPGGDGIRHWCSQSDGLSRYSWTRHDGMNFGSQELFDGPLKLTTSFVKKPGGRNGGEWTARITVEADKLSQEYNPQTSANETVSLIWYTSSEAAPGSELRPSQSSPGEVTGLRGYTPALGDFSLKLIPHSGKILHESYLSTVSLGVHLLRETVVSSLRLARDAKSGKQWIALAGELLGQGPSDKGRPEPNLIATQLTVTVPFVLDIVYESNSVLNRDGELSGETYSHELAYKEKQFDSRFEDTFPLSEKGYNASEIRFAQAAFSNLVGGIGYFYGSSRVMSTRTTEPVPYWKAPLYTAVPSRSHFPRGFLWDEGFHGLLVARWDRTIELDIMAHWFDLMNAEGWIPREQILGSEALARVPEEFVTQRNTNANPPTFFLTLLQLLGDQPRELDTLSHEYQTLNRMFPRLQAWYSWFNTTQAGELPGSYRWRGRDSETNTELNPKTLTSGLDDYPRASHPSVLERHVDLRCWMHAGALALSSVATALGRIPAAIKYSEAAAVLANQQILADLHWSAYTGTFSDYGLHSDAVELRRPPPPSGSSRRGGGTSQPPRRVALRAPEVRLVDSAFGYVSLFPMLLKLLPADCPRLGQLLQKLTRTDLLWTPYGLRSLAKSSPMYMKRNTEHDPPYWRGQIWMNINYLAVASLHHYGSLPGPNQEAAITIYKRLRKNLIGNVMKQYQRTGYLWEQYSDKNGEGSGCKPFTGWTSLVVLIMSEQY